MAIFKDFMVNATLGVGIGDFATVRDSWVFMQGIEPLFDDYTFRQVADVNEINNWPAGAPALDFNHHTVRYICPWNDSSQGDPTRGYKIQKTGAGIMEMRVGVLANPSTLADQLILENLYYEKLTNDNVIIVRPNTWVTPSTATIIVRNCIFKGHTNNGYGLYFNNAQDRIYLSNIKMDDLWEAFYDLMGGAGGVHLAENISISNCQTAFRFWLGHWTFRNCVGVNCNANVWNAGNANYNLINSADDDGSIAGGATTQTDCRGNITPADEFQSTNFANPNWLKLIEGEFYSPNRYTGGAPQLGRTGVAPTLDGTDRDIERMLRPGPDGAYSIGTHELQYRTIRARYRNLILDAGAVYMNFVSQDDPGILLGATRGGNVFTIEQEIKDMPVDGVKGPAKGSRRFTRVNAKLTCHFIEHTLALYQIGIPGSETTIGPDHIKLSRNLVITDEDYINNIVIVAQVSATNETVVCGVRNALADGNFEMGTEDSNERGLTLQFTGHLDKQNLDEEPWILMYPEILTTTAGP